MKWYEIDVSDAFIRGMEKVGLASNVVRISEERQAAKLAGATPPKRRRPGRRQEKEKEKVGAAARPEGVAAPSRPAGYQRPATAGASRRGGSSRTTGVAKVRFAAGAVRDEEVETAAGRQGRCW